MIWRNKKANNFSERKNRFSIRKLTVGAASVMIGAFFLSIQSGEIVNADTVNTNSTTEVTSTDQNQSAEVKTDDGSVGNNNNADDSTATSTTSNDKEAIVEDAQKKLSKNDVIDNDNVKQVHQTIHYKEEGTDKNLSEDNKQDVTFVPYYKKAQATVKYVDDSSKSNLETDTVKGYVGNQTPYNGKEQIKSYEDKGYELKSNDIPEKGIKFDNDKDQSYSAHFVHGIEELSDSSQVIRTIHYEGAGDKTPKDITQSVTFNATGTKDKVTGKTDLTWDAEKQLDAVNSPLIKGYHVVSVSSDSKDDKNVDAVNVDHSNQDYTVTVTYAENGTEVKDNKNIPSTQKINFVDENGNQLYTPDKQTSTFTYSGDTYDKFTGDKLSNGSWNENEHTYKTINIPEIKGYEAVSGFITDKDGNKVVKGLTATPNNPNVEATIVYVRLVDGSVTYHDDTLNKNLTTDSLTSGKPGDKIDYATQDKIASYEDQGYKLVSNDFTDGNETYDKNAENNKFIVHLVHDTVPVNPENPGKPGQPINPNDPDGAKYLTVTDKQSLTKKVTRTINYLDGSNKQVADSHTDSVAFSGSGVIDKVTGNFVNLNSDGSIKDQNGKLTWTVTNGSANFAKVTSPTVNRMHVETISPAEDADGNDVKSQTVTKDDSDITINVYYAENGTKVKNKQSIPSSQTINFVDENGNTLHDSDKQTSTFTYSGDTYDAVTGDKLSDGSWNETEHTYNTVDIPKIDGYVAIKGYSKNSDGKYVAGGLTATNDKPDVSATVVYAKVGKIVPVDTDHNPIPNTSTPNYTNDPTDPTKVTPNEPVPEVDGYTPETSSVTPEDPTRDTQVVYVQLVNGSISYIDDTTNSTLSTDNFDTGKVGSNIDYTTKDKISSYEAQGYKLVSNNFTDGNETYNKDVSKNNFKVHLAHATTDITPDNPGGGYSKEDLEKKLLVL